jgi:hypothetical protein
MNGAVASAVLTTDLPTALPTELPAAKAAAATSNGTAIALPMAATPPAEAERSIGEAVADAILMLGAGVIDWENGGGLRPSTRRLAGERFAKICMMQLEHPGGDDDFAAIARSAGRYELWRRTDAGFRAHYGDRWCTRFKNSSRLISCEAITPDICCLDRLNSHRIRTPKPVRRIVRRCQKLARIRQP